MKKIKLNKKKYLITAAAFFLLLIISLYFKSTAINQVQIFNKSGQFEAEVLLTEKDNKKITAAESGNKSLKKNQNPAEKEAEIENIALITEIKDPFAAQKKQEANQLAEAVNESSKKQWTTNKNQDLILLEKNIIAETEIGQRKKETYKNKNEEAAAGSNKLKNIKLPFKLLGIIKNRTNASALFLYQGQNILKKEKDKIDLFQIKKINKKEIILTYQKEELKLQLWEAEENEN